MGSPLGQIITDKVPFHKLNSEGYITMTVIQRKVPSIERCADVADRQPLQFNEGMLGVRPQIQTEGIQVPRIGEMDGM